MQERLRAAHAALRDLIGNPATWQVTDAVGGALGAIVHTAYHLGEIRQRLGVLRGRPSGR